MADETLPLAKASWSMRHALVGDEVQEYVEVSLEFGLPVYARVCSRDDAIFVAAVGRCAVCPQGCVLSTLFSRSAWVPGLMPPGDTAVDCICDLSFEDIQLRSRTWPGDWGFEDVRRETPHFFEDPTALNPSRLEAYGTAVWQFDSLMVRVTCAGEPWPHFSRFGFNGLPLPESLWWLRRFETAFGIEDIDQLVADASRRYNDRLVVFILPVSRTHHGRTQQLGPTPQELLACELKFPFLAGPEGEPVARIARLGDVPLLTRPCLAQPLALVRRQIESILKAIPEAAIQRARCHEKWRTSVQPRPPAGSGAAPETIRAQESGRRVRRVGLLMARADFDPGVGRSADHAPVCATLRWQLRLRAYNMMERALSYTAVDAVNGCWDFMVRVVNFTSQHVMVQTDACMYAREQPEYWRSPCCNAQLTRTQCCALRTRTAQHPVAHWVDTSQLAKHCLVDPTGSAMYAGAVMTAALAWRRRTSEGAGMPSCRRSLVTSEQAHVSAWRTLERCHADVMGRYDRSLRAFAGMPCLVDEDCFTRCEKPALRTLQTQVRLVESSLERGQVLGRCLVPKANRHRYIMQCIAQRSGHEVLLLFGQELGLAYNERTIARISDVLATSRDRRSQECIGPYAARGVRYTMVECLAPKACNWNIQVRTRQECVDVAFGTDYFCSSSEGHGPQLSLKAGCLYGRITDRDCFQARELVRGLENECLAGARNAAAMRICGAMADGHDEMLRSCRSARCTPPTAFFWTDDGCHDLRRLGFSNCHEQCNIPTGPNPLIKHPQCYTELLPSETAQDCYQTPGDAMVHHAPTTLGLRLTMELPERARPRYCSVRVWRQSQDVYLTRSRIKEAAHLENQQSTRDLRLADHVKMTEREAHDARIHLAKNPPLWIGCDVGVLAMDTPSKMFCQSRGDDCCLSPTNLTTARCAPCVEANTTVCREGHLVYAKWAPNGELLPATVMKDLGDDLAFVAWDEAPAFHREVPWPLVHTRDGRACAPESEGCSAHSQCRAGEYCFSCEQCVIEYGGNPPPHLCAPCPTLRGGACADISGCQKLQASIDGNCFQDQQIPKCPCKVEWSVRGEWPGAPSDQSINDCFYDIAQKYHWCEVNRGAETCSAETIVGKTRFIEWQQCQPPSCSSCHCDCSPTCLAYNVLPVDGRLPLEVVAAASSGTEDQLRLPSNLLAYSGRVAPNCSNAGYARVRGLCPFCVVCCATLCHDRWEKAFNTRLDDFNFTSAPDEINIPIATGGGTATAHYDCTATNVTGCADAPSGWADNIGRSCNDYKILDLCTHGGDYGRNWPQAEPAQTFADFKNNLRAASEACCYCGGGADCADSPEAWTDPRGFGCRAYVERDWCNRSGYGPNWDPGSGSFELGAGGVDAISACCGCGGGVAIASAQTTLHFVDTASICNSIWPTRSVFAFPPWIAEHGFYCRHLNGICQRKLFATVHDPGIDRSVPDKPRLYALCEQRAYATGMRPVTEDSGESNAPGGSRRLTVFDLYRGRLAQPITHDLLKLGTSINVDFFGNSRYGMCYYRLPDPLALYGGPRRERMPPPLLAAHSNDDQMQDVFEVPGIHQLGWPLEFWGALPDYDEGKDIGVALEKLRSSVTLPDPSTTLRALLAQQLVEVVRPSDLRERQQDWWDALDEVKCQGQAGEMSEFQIFRRWQPGRLDTEQHCKEDVCNVDDAVRDPEECHRMEGCSKSCMYCASQAEITEEQGLCYTEVPNEVARCADLGGVIREGMIFDERLGIGRAMRVCAFLHRPLIYCTTPGDSIKRCTHFDEDSCETDPLAVLMRCGLDIRQCQTAYECHNAGRCSDSDLSLSWADPGTCVVTPLIDALVRNGCDHDGEFCYLHIDPPFGMEVRKRHHLLDLLGPDALGINGTAPMGTPLGTRGASQDSLQGLGRLNKNECEALAVQPGHTAVWLARARTADACLRLYACCIARPGDRCQLFSGPTIDTKSDPVAAAAGRKECALCGGEWLPVFRWEGLDDGWHRGEMQSPGRKWDRRRWEAANEWVDVVDTNAIRQVLENAFEIRLGRQRVSATRCLLEPLLTAVQTVAEACGAPEPTASTAAAPAEGVDQKQDEPSAEKSTLAAASWPLPPLRASLGSVVLQEGLPGHASFGAISLRWHEHSTPRGLNGVDFEAAIEPLEPELGSGAPQLALRGRAELANLRLLHFATGPQESSSTIPPNFDTLEVGEKEGFPPWMINAMMLMDNPDLDKEKMEILFADEEERRRRREAWAASQAKAADASSGLPEASKSLLLGLPAPTITTTATTTTPSTTITTTAATTIPNTATTANSASSSRGALTATTTTTPATTTPLGDRPVRGSSTPLGVRLVSGSCRSVVASDAGEVVGQLLGDCVHLHTTAPLTNAVELCLPLTYGVAALTSTDIATHFGVIYDFARKDIVPAFYNVSLPAAVPREVGEIPGEVASALRSWASSPDFGRLKPGWSAFSPLNLPAALERDGTRLCAKVFEAGLSYCPVVRLDARIYAPLPPDQQGKELPLVDSACPALDAELAEVHQKHVLADRTSATYRRRDMAAADTEMLQLRKVQHETYTPPPKGLVCPVGGCLALNLDEGFWTAMPPGEIYDLSSSTASSAASCGVDC